MRNFLLAGFYRPNIILNPFKLLNQVHVIIVSELKGYILLLLMVNHVMLRHCYQRRAYVHA